MATSKHIMLAGLLALMLAALASGCSHKVVQPVLVTDTLRIVTSDTVIVEVRDTTLSVPVPQVRIEQVKPADTTSVLTDGLYTSEARLQDGWLYHSLYTNKDAQVQVNAPVTNTTHIYNKEKESSHAEQPPPVVKEVEKELHWWQVWAMRLGYLTAGLLLLRSCFWVYKKRGFFLRLLKMIH